ncbi:MAG: nitroreductase family protein [Lachnospiraceae bacterium]|nr:nitroreductase family protein [Lachnospiraceae bacterium]
MEFQKVLEERRSVRAYTTEKVSKEQVEEILKAAQLAPSWKNSETGRYYVVMSDEMLKKVKEECLPSFNARNSENAPVLIVTGFVTGDAGFGTDGPVNDMGDMWGAYDLGLQNENLCLKARELGLDTLIMGIRDEVALKSVLDIPENVQVAAVIALGYRAVEPKMPPRKDLAVVAKFY